MGIDPEAPRRPEPPPDPGADLDASGPESPPAVGPDLDASGPESLSAMGPDPDANGPESLSAVGSGQEERRRPEPPHYPPPSSANWPGWMPPGTSVPPGLPGPPSRYPTKRRRSPAGCLLAVALFIVVAAALIWVVTHRQ
jgi:hypothetical protein